MPCVKLVKTLPSSWRVEACMDVLAILRAVVRRRTSISASTVLGLRDGIEGVKFARMRGGWAI
jgi:hypothetical protein